MIEKVSEQYGESENDVIQEAKKTLSLLEKDIDVSGFFELNEKIPPKLKDLYKRLSKINSKKDIQSILMDGKEFWYFVNLAEKYINTKAGRRFMSALEDAFGVSGSMIIEHENFSGIKLATVKIGGKKIFAINYTIDSGIYGPRKVGDKAIVIERSSDRCYVRDVYGEKMEGWYSVMPDGNLLEISENGKYHPKTKFFWDLSFSKQQGGDFKINLTQSPESMFGSLYLKKKEVLLNHDKIKSLQDMGYVFEWEDYEKIVRIKKNTMISKRSENILSYETDKDFFSWIEKMRSTVDSEIKQEKEAESQFEGFYTKYFNTNATYKENTRYEIVRENGTRFYLLDRENKKKKITKLPLSIFNEKGRTISDKDMDMYIAMYEAEQVYIKFIAKNNKSDVLNNQGKHVENSYYLGYPFVYKQHLVQLETSSLTKRKYAIVVRKETTEEYVGTVYLDNFMSASDIEKQIDKLTK